MEIDEKKLALIKEDIQSTLTKMLAQWDKDTHPIVKDSFRALWRIKWELLHYHLERDLDIDECMYLYDAYRTIQGLDQYKYNETISLTYKAIIDKIIAKFFEMLEAKDADKSEIKYTIKKVLPQLVDKINEEQTLAFVDLLKDLYA